MCQRVRENFVFDLKEVLWYPVNYSSLRVKVEEFANAQRVVNFTTDGELKLNDDARVLDVSLVKEEKTLNVVRICHAFRQLYHLLNETRNPHRCS